MKKTTKPEQSTRPMFARYLEGPKLSQVVGGYIIRRNDTDTLPPDRAPNTSTYHGDTDQ